MSIPEFLTAAVLVETGSPIEIIERIKIPELTSGQVLAKIHYAGICHSQLMEVRGKRGPDKYVPHLLGHEASATIVKTADDVSKVQAGDKVVLGWIKGDGIDSGPCCYLGPENQIINSGAVTTFSDYSIVSENRVVKKPPETPDDLAVLYGCALPTGAGLVLNELKPLKGTTIAVIGLGGIGLSALMALKKFEPAQVIAIDIEEDKLVLAHDLGATHSIDAKAPDIKEQVLNLTSGAGVDYAVESAGLVKTIELGFELIKRNGGQLIFASHPENGDKISIDPFELICGKSIKGTWGGASSPDKDIPLLGQMYAEGKLNLDALLSHRYALHDINRALDDLESRKIVRALLEISPDES